MDFNPVMMREFLGKNKDGSFCCQFALTELDCNLKICKLKYTCEVVFISSLDPYLISGGKFLRTTEFYNICH